MQAKDLIVLGSSRLLGKLYCSDIDIADGTITAEKILVNIDANPNPSNLCSHNSSTGTGIVVVGNPNGRHIAIDPDEIQGKNGQTTADTLWLNYGGGVVRLSTSGTIQANNGTLTATTFSGTTGTITNITATGTSTFGTATITNATVNSTLKANKIEAVNVDVADELRAAKYSIETVQNLGGHFLVCPTLEFPSNATNFSITVTKVSSTEITIAITDNQLVNQTFVDVPWNQYSKVKFVGTVNNIGIPTCSGYIQSFTTGTNYGTMTLRMTVTSDIADKFATAFTGNSTKVDNLSVMMYQLCPNTSQSTTLYPIGIYLTAYGSNRYSYIDVYGGTATTAVARMGKLDGLPNVNNTAPTGWGFYAKGNAYFDGTLVTKSGQIGGFSIGTYTLKNGTPGADSSVFMTTNFTDTAVAIGGASSALNSWRFGAGSHFGVTADGTLYCNNIKASGGTIGNFTIANGNLYTTLNNQSHSAWNSSNSGIFISPNGIAGGSGGTWWLWNDGSAKIGTGFNVSTAGVVTAGGFEFNTTQLNAYGTASAAGTSSNGIYRVLIQSAPGTSGGNIAFGVAGRDSTSSDWSWKYYVTHSGYFYAGSGEIASSVKIGGKNQSEYLNTNVQSQNFSEGTMLFKDPMFSTGVNGTTKYANSGANYVTWTRAAKSSDNPMTGTSYEMVCTNTGAASPGLGGFYWSHASRKNAVFVYRIIAKIPTGHNIQFHSNATGDNPVRVWLTPQAGTGKFEEYIFKQICGSTGTLSTTGYFAIDGTAGTSSAPVTWYVAYATAFDMTNLAETNNYITYISANDGIKVHNANDETNYLQLNSTAIKFVKSGTEKITIHSDGYVMVGNNSGTNGNVYIDSSVIQLRKGSTAYVDLNNNGNLTLGIGSSGHVTIKSDGLHVWSGTESTATNEIAKIGSTVQIGASNTGYVNIASSGMQIYGNNGSNLLAHIGYGETDSGSSSYYIFGMRRDGVSISNWAANTSYIRGQNVKYNDKTYVCIFEHTSSDTFNNNNWVLANGLFSVAEGYATNAVGAYSHAEGTWTTAWGGSNGSAHAEGRSTYASLGSHAEGSSTTAISGSHAEGDSTYAYLTSHAEGYYSEATGLYSHAQNYHTLVENNYQTAIGKYNNNLSDSAFEIGNGTGESARSNAFTVDWNGNVYCYPNTINLGTYVSTGILTGSGGHLMFSIPLGRTLPSNASISLIEFDVCARCGYNTANSGAGYYIVKDSASGTSTVHIKSNATSRFYNAGGTAKDLLVSHWAGKSIQGNTNIYISWNTNTTDFFTQNATNRGYLNNQPVTVFLANINITLTYS